MIQQNIEFELDELQAGFMTTALYQLQINYDEVKIPHVLEKEIVTVYLITVYIGNYRQAYELGTVYALTRITNEMKNIPIR